MKPWQRGYELERLRDLAQRFQTHDGNRCLGAFSKVKENAVANWLAEERLYESSGAVVVARLSKSKQQVKDFRGSVIANADAGTLVVERVAGDGMIVANIIGNLAGLRPIVWKSWSNHPDELLAAELLELNRIGTFITAASEMKAIWARGVPVTNDQPYDVDSVGICRTALAPPPMEPLRSWVPLVARLWQDHYSSYNKRKSWHAVALRSFGGDPSFIEKPAEMSKKWKEEHAAMLDAPCVDTPLLDQLPEARPLLEALNCDTERVRLMRLTGSGGELTRHADITDRNAGLRDGQIARFHLPIITDPGVVFTTWDYADRPHSVHMAADNWWYLDVRKPHAAVNRSGVERVHLVADLVVNEWVREQIRAAQ